MFACYDLKAAKEKMSPDVFRRQTASLWRYKDILPVHDDRNIVTLGEGMTTLEAWDQAAKTAGVFCSPEGATTVAAAVKLRQQGSIRESDRVAVLFTATGLKYTSLIKSEMPAILDEGELKATPAGASLQSMIAPE